MKLLLDQNLSPRLVSLLSDLLPGSTHVSSLGMDRAPDETVWDHARLHDYLLVTKDADFSELSTLRGFPPKVIWLQAGNCTTQYVKDLLRANFLAIEHLATSEGLGVLSIG